MKQASLLTVSTILAITISAQCMAQPEPGKLPPLGPREEMRRQALQQVVAFNGQPGRVFSYW